jgi:RNA polymerase sigma-70 factor (ECF subfamily)
MSRANRHDAALDAALVENARKNEAEAFGRIVDAYQSRIIGFVSRMVPTEEDALDVAQEVFIRAYQHLDRFDSRSSLRTWLFKIAHNLCIDRARRAKRTPVQLSVSAGLQGEADWELLDQTEGPEDLVINQELRDIVEEAIASMSDKHREVLLLHEEQEMAYEEISQAIKVPVGTVKSRLFVARAHLKRAIANYQNGGEA